MTLRCRSMTACSVPSLLGRYLAQLGALGYGWTQTWRGHSCTGWANLSASVSVYLWLHRVRSSGRLSWSWVSSSWVHCGCTAYERVGKIGLCGGVGIGITMGIMWLIGRLLHSSRVPAYESVTKQWNSPARRLFRLNRGAYLCLALRFANRLGHFRWMSFLQ